MEPTGITVVSQLITDARSRHGAFAVAELYVEGSLLDEVMDHVLSLGGTVGLDEAVVEGVRVRELPEEASVPLVRLVDEDETRQLLPMAEPPEA